MRNHFVFIFKQPSHVDSETQETAIHYLSNAYTKEYIIYKSAESIKLTEIEITLMFAVRICICKHTHI